MKTRIPVASLSAVLLLFGAPSLKAQSSPYYDPSVAIKLIDQNYRDAAEREKAMLVAFSPATYDLNRDGKLDDAEFAAWTKRVRPILETNARFMKKYDLNHDRTLDDAEWQAAWVAGFNVNADAKPRATK